MRRRMASWSKRAFMLNLQKWRLESESALALVRPQETSRERGNRLRRAPRARPLEGGNRWGAWGSQMHEQPVEGARQQDGGRQRQHPGHREVAQGGPLQARPV